jgi:WD repeat-containing protein 26
MGLKVALDISYFLISPVSDPHLHRDARELTLLECISPSVFLPPSRLAKLLSQVKRNQISSCLYHNTASSPSLYQDHSCDRSNFPVQAVRDLSRHTGEVWYVRFSHDGSRLASCGSDGNVIIYDMSTFNVQNILHGNNDGGICTMSWSPDDSMIVTCCRDKKAKLWNSRVSRPLVPFSYL